MSCDILSLEWNSDGRDIHIVEPVLCYLESHYKMTVVRDSIWYGEFKLLKYRPKILVIANATGASNNFNIMKLADKLGIITVEFVSEGVYAKPDNKKDAELIFWGWNKDKRLYSDLILFWSKAMKEGFEQFLDRQILKRVEISGATGFDRYKILNFMNREEFLKRKGKECYKKVVGLAGWTFDSFAIEDSVYTKGTLGNISKEDKVFFLSSRDKVNNIYNDLIKNNKDILFILKYHPGVYKKELSEFANLSTYENTIEIVTEEKIEDIINISDLWLCFESTSCIEAWLLNKQTIFINPDINFERSNLYLGNPIAKNKEEANFYVNSFYRDGSVPTFLEKERVRRKIVEDIVGYDDGNNHKRAGIRIYELYKEYYNKKKSKFDRFIIYIFFRASIRFIIFNTPLKFLFYKKYKLIRSYELVYRRDKRNDEVRKYHEALERFHGE